MHELMLAVVIGCCCWLRWSWASARGLCDGTWGDRWQRALSAFLLPPLLLITTAIAISFMGPNGQMVGYWEGWCSYGGALIFLGWSGILGLYLVWQGCQTLRRIRSYPTRPIPELGCQPPHDDRQCSQHPAVQWCRVLDSPLLYSAQIGFWQPELVISQGMLATLNSTQLAAVITHEQAHAYYQDTFWFFWLGWLRRLTSWLPYTEELWQELLILRELRADSWAAQRVDSLVLAEVLLAVVKSPWQQTQEWCASFGEIAAGDRLTERMNALLTTPHQLPESAPQQWLWLCWLWLPLLLVPFHT